ncbi:hypothetical protein [Streptomyces sp. G45]|uniref:hypothetical protein n=1 Tax=Streptomyces sp. G45 TaxID=3406627 RepID=UPI003C2147E5
MHRANGRTYYSRADLQKVHGLSQSTLQNLWTDRENNGHPDAEVIDGVMHWDGTVWVVWYKELQRQRATAVTTNAPNLTGDPDEEVGPAEAARVCGFADSATISHYVKNPPEGWPDPDTYDLLPSGRRRPKGRRGLAYPYQGDERLTLARKALAANPGATNAELIPQLQEQTEKTYSRPTWNLILKSAREHPEE